jgi:hypothetical protein
MGRPNKMVGVVLQGNLEETKRFRHLFRHDRGVLQRLWVAISGLHPPPKESTVSYMAMSSGFVLVWLGLQISRLDWTLHFFLVAINYNNLHGSALFHKATPSVHAGYV